MDKILPRAFYNRSTITTAHDLLGKKLIRTIGSKKISGIIVETEAYIFSDSACHAHRGKTAANQALFGPIGHAYIYFIYGNHYCINAVAHTKEEIAGGVLIRALEPLDNIELMQQYRKQPGIKNLTNGPGKLAQALHITKKLYGIDLTQPGELYIAEGTTLAAHNIQQATRIGISKNCEQLWRFFIKNNEFVSK